MCFLLIPFWEPSVRYSSHYDCKFKMYMNGFLYKYKYRTFRLNVKQNNKSLYTNYHRLSLLIQRPYLVIPLLPVPIWEEGNPHFHKVRPATEQLAGWWEEALPTAVTSPHNIPILMAPHGSDVIMLGMLPRNLWFYANFTI